MPGEKIFMTAVFESLIEVREHNEPDYKPLIDYLSKFKCWHTCDFCFYFE